MAVNGFIEPLWSQKPKTGCKGGGKRKGETLHLLLGALFRMAEGGAHMKLVNAVWTVAIHYSVLV